MHEDHRGAITIDMALIKLQAPLNSATPYSRPITPQRLTDLTAPVGQAPCSATQAGTTPERKRREAYHVFRIIE